MRIYHGANQIVRTPKFGIGRAYNDFGLGFYCTENEDCAAEWAVSPGSNGFVSVYAFDDAGLRTIDLCSTQYTILHWLSLLMNYREFDSSSMLLHRAKEYISTNFPVDYQSCDCISGYRADNINFMLSQLFLDGEISFQTLSSCLKDKASGRQFVIKSNRAFERISYAGYMTADSGEIYPAKTSREIRVLQKILKQRYDPGLYIKRLIDEGVKAYDARLQ